MTSGVEDSPKPSEGESESLLHPPNGPTADAIGVDPSGRQPSLSEPPSLAAKSTRADITRSLVVLASVTLIIYGMHLAAPYLVQIFLAVFISIVTQPVVFHLRQRGWPMSVILIAAGLILAGSVILGGLLAMDGLRTALAGAPGYQDALRKEIGAAIAWLAQYGVPVKREDLDLLFESAAIVDALRAVAGATADLLRQTFAVVLLVIFMWLEAPRLPKRVEPHLGIETSDRLRVNLSDLRHYMGLKALMSLLTGVCVALWCLIMDIPFAFVMGIAAFVMNFIPVVGSILASFPALAISFIDHGTGHMLVVGIGYMVINIGISNGLEPKVLGRGLGLSPLAIVLSLLIWGWILGPVGMLLSVPLTMTIRALLKDVEGCETFVAFLSSDDGPRRKT